MSRDRPGPDAVDEFDLIARLFRPLTNDAPEALRLLDDAAILPARPGFDLVISKDMIVEGVHFLPSDPLDQVAQKLLRTNLSDLAAKGADPYAYFLAVSWSARCGWAERAAFAAGLRRDQDIFGLSLLGGDTTATPGPLTASATILGWVPAGQAVPRSGARPGDALLVSGTIGDGWLGLQAALAGRLDAPHLIERYRRPSPRLALGAALRAHARASADVSDGLVADAGHVALASGVGLRIALDQLPLSPDGRAYVESQTDAAKALTRLATGGDDYELVIATAPDQVTDLVQAATRQDIALTVIGRVVEGQGVRISFQDRPIPVVRAGYRHS
jgi:thiamine-monophosphate kinase